MADQASELVERTDLIKHLTAIVEDRDKPFVVSLDGSFGTGKTTFIEQWQTSLDEASHKTVMFNAWGTDFAEDALLAFISALKSSLAMDEQSEFKLANAAKAVSALLVRNKEKVFIESAKFIVKSLVGTQASEKFESLLGGADFSKDSTYLDKIKDFEATQKAIEDFKLTLKNAFKKAKGDKNNIIRGCPR